MMMMMTMIMMMMIIQNIHIFETGEIIMKTVSENSKATVHEVLAPIHKNHPKIYVLSHTFPKTMSWYLLLAFVMQSGLKVQHSHSLDLVVGIHSSLHSSHQQKNASRVEYMVLRDKMYTMSNVYTNIYQE